MGMTAVSDSEFVTTSFVGKVTFRPMAGSVALVAAALGEPSKRLAAAPVLDAAALHAYVGRFASEELDTWTNVSVVDGALWIRARYEAWAPMTLIAPEVFSARGGRLDFVRDRKGQVTGYRLSGGRMANIQFVRTARPLRWSPLDRPGLTTTATPR